jgi:dihydrofolate reductase
MSTHSTGTADAVMPPVELTLIVAATKNMGIGRGGTLPWTGLRKEMAYFARVTKRAGVRPNGQAADHVGSTH